MKQKTRWVITALIAVLICTVSIAVSFAEENTATLDLPITVQVHGETSGSSDPTAEFTLTSLNGAPMPEEAQSDVYRFEITGNGKVTLHFVFTESGTWQYELTAKTDKGEISPEKLVITIQAAEETVFVVAETEDGKKCDLIFHVQLKTPGPTPPPPLTGDDSQLLLYAVLAGVSFLLIAALTVYLIIRAKRAKKNMQ